MEHDIKKTEHIFTRETGFLWNEVEYLVKACGMKEEKAELIKSCFITINDVIRKFINENN